MHWMFTHNRALWKIKKCGSLNRYYKEWQIIISKFNACYKAVANTAAAVFLQSITLRHDSSYNCTSALIHSFSFSLTFWFWNPVSPKIFQKLETGFLCIVKHSCDKHGKILIKASVFSNKDQNLHWSVRIRVGFNSMFFWDLICICTAI